MGGQTFVLPCGRRLDAPPSNGPFKRQGTLFGCPVCRLESRGVAGVGYLISWTPMESPLPIAPEPTGPVVMKWMNQPARQLLLPLPSIVWRT
jgi:hypothetical protein